MGPTFAERLKKLNESAAPTSQPSGMSFAERLAAKDDPTIQPAEAVPATQPTSAYRTGQPMTVGTQDRPEYVAPQPAPETDLERQFGDAVSNLPPEVAARVIGAQEAYADYIPTEPGRDSPATRTALRFVSPIIDLWAGTPARLAGIDQPSIKSGLEPPQSTAEAHAAGIATLLGEGVSYLGPGAIAKGLGLGAKVAKGLQLGSIPHAAGKAAQAGARALGGTGRLAQYGAGISGFVAPIAASRAISGEISPTEAAVETAISPVKFPYDVAESAVLGTKEMASALTGETAPREILGAYETLAPAAAIGAMHALKPTPAKKPVVEQVSPPGARGGAVASTPTVPAPEVASGPKKYYHGTNAESLTAKQLDPFSGSHESLFGHGIYFTDSPTVAQGYAKTRSSRKGSPTVYEAELKPRQTLDLESGLPKGVADAIKSAVAEPDLRAAVTAAAAKPGATGESVLTALQKATSEYSHHNEIPTSEFVEQYQTISDNLRSLGYDAMAHTGGKRTGGKPHRVMIVLNPESVTSFSPTAAPPGKPPTTPPTATAGAPEVPPTPPTVFGNKKPGALKRLLQGDQAALPLDVAEADARRIGRTAETSTDVRFDVKDFNDALKTSYKNGPSKEDMLNIDAVLKGEEALHRLPEPMQEPVIRMRDKIDAMSRKLIDSGAAEGPLELTIEKNQGFYVTRAYQKYNDPKWAERVPQDVRDKAKALLRSEYPDATPAEIDGRIEAIIFNKSAADSPIGLLAKGSKLGSKDLSILKHRQDIAPEIRALMGEYKDARFNYANSVEKMSRLISNHQFLSEVREMGLGKFLTEKPTPEGFARLASPESSVMEPLNGLYTTPEIKKAFESFRSVQDSPAWLRIYMKANAAVKAGKTIYSPITHVRNTISGAATALAAGNWNPKNFKQAFTAAKTNLTGRGSESSREYVKKLTRYGLLNQDTRASELENLARGVEAGDPQSFAEKMAEGPLTKGLRAPAEMYQAEDNLWRVFHYEGEVAKYRKAFPEMPVEQLEKGAAERASNIYQNYAKVPKNIKALAKFPLIGNFPSFTYELFRTGYNLLELTAKEMADPKTRAIGAQRAVGILAAASGTAAATMAARHINGITRDEDNDLRKFMPPWSQNGQILYTNKAADGKLGYIDLSYSDYYGQLKAPIVALMRGEDWKSALWEGTTQLVKPFADEEILASKLVEAAANKKQSGGPVYNEQAPELDKWLARIEHVWSGAVEPGAISSARRIAQGLSGKMNEYGTQRDATVESLNVLTGQRRQILDVRQSLQFAAKRFANQTQEAGRLATGPATRRGNVEMSEIEKGAGNAMSARIKLFHEMHEMVGAARRTGIPDKELGQILLSGGIARPDVDALLRGKTTGQRIGAETMGRIMSAPAGAERKKALQNKR